MRLSAGGAYESSEYSKHLPGKQIIQVNCVLIFTSSVFPQHFTDYHAFNHDLSSYGIPFTQLLKLLTALMNEPMSL